MASIGDSMHVAKHRALSCIRDRQRRIIVISYGSLLLTKTKVPHSGNSRKLESRLLRLTAMGQGVLYELVESSFLHVLPRTSQQIR